MSEINAERTIFTLKSESFIADIAAGLSISPASVSIVCSNSDSSKCTGSPPLHALGNSTEVRVVVSGVMPARLKQPTRLAFSADGSMLVVSDTGNNAIRKLDLVSMTLTTIAGKSTGEAGFVNGHATSNAVVSACVSVFCVCVSACACVCLCVYLYR